VAETHIVVKQFGGPGGKEFIPGQAVDATAWPNLKVLVAARYLREQEKLRPIKGKG
jgi:hypothetical protein